MDEVKLRMKTKRHHAGNQSKDQKDDRDNPGHTVHFLDSFGRFFNIFFIRQI